MRDVIWSEWWRVEEGEVFHDKGWAWKDDPDMIFFNDPDDVHFDEEPDSGFHVDELFESYEDAKTAALTWLDEKIRQYQLKLARLHGTNTA